MLGCHRQGTNGCYNLPVNPIIGEQRNNIMSDRPGMVVGKTEHPVVGSMLLVAQQPPISN